MLARLSLRRTSSRLGLLGLIAITLALITAVLAGVTGYTQLAATEALRSLASAPGEQGYFRVHTTALEDSKAQQAAFSALSTELGLDNGLRVSAASYTDPRPLVASGGSAANLPADLSVLPVGTTPTTTTAGSVDRFTSYTEVRNEPVPAALHAETAASLELRLGDTFAVEGNDRTVRLELVATLNPTGADAAFLDPVPVQGADSQPVAVVVPPGAVPAFGSQTKVQWIYTVDEDTVSAAALSGLADGLGALPQRITSDTDVNGGGVVPSGQLAGLLAEASDATQAVRAIIPNALVLLVALSAVTIVQFARLLAGTRSVEDRLIGGHGASPLQRAGVAAREIAPLAVLAVAVGWAAAVALGPLLPRGSETDYLEGAGELAGASWGVPLACAAAMVCLHVGVAFVDGLRGGGTPAEAARSGRMASFGILTLVGAVAALSVWQFLLYRSPLSETASGNLAVNPLAAPAPALLLVACTAIALLVVAWLAKRVEARTASRAGLRASLAARQVARRITSYVIPIVLVTVTVGSATFTAFYTETTSRSQEAAAELAVGSDVRVTLPGPLVMSAAADSPDLQPYTDIDSVDAASLVYRGEARLTSVTAPLLAAQSAQLPMLISAGGSVVDADRLSEALAFKSPVLEPALTLRGSATQVRMQLTSTATSEPAGAEEPASRRAVLTAWIRSDQGALVPVPAGSLTLSGPGERAHSLSFVLPEGLTPSGIAAIDVELAPSPVPQSYSLEITSIASNGGIGTGETRFVEGSTVKAADGVFGTAQAGVQSLGEGVGVSFPEEGSTVSAAKVRLMQDAEDQAPLRVALSSQLLADLDLAIGDPVSLRPGGVEIDAQVAAVSPVIPGTTESVAALTDLDAYAQAMLGSSPAQPRPGEIWLATGDRDSVTEAATVRAATGATVTSADNNLVSRFLSPAATALWIGTIGALLIGATALIASMVTLLQSRRPEVAVLRALGMQARDQASGRRWEVLTVGGTAVALGLLAGLAVSVLTVPLLAEAVVVGGAESLRAPLAVAVVPLLCLLVAQVVILLGSAWFYGEGVRRQALAPALSADASLPVAPDVEPDRGPDPEESR